MSYHWNQIGLTIKYTEKKKVHQLAKVASPSLPKMIMS